MPPADDLPTSITNSAKRFDSAKAKQAARHPQRPGEHCKAGPGAFVPEINRNRCEGKSDCVAVCPYDVFEVRRIDAEDKLALSLVGKMKSFAHGGKTAYAVRAADCQACGLCVVACPEKAISLVRLP